ncbi:MAG TPA: ATP-binding protein [Pyrinomonadaceae bacterium]|nr:ATP-binding protein [Pyrinomonadaceae bacterium]
MPLRASPFAALPRDAGTHFRLFYFAAVARVYRYLSALAAADGGAPLASEFPFLAGYEAELRACEAAAGATGARGVDATAGAGEGEDVTGGAGGPASDADNVAGNDVGIECGPEWWREEIESWEQEAECHLPLRALASELSLTFEERLALVLAGLVEEDIRFGALFAALQEPLSARRPCLGLLGALAAGTPERGAASAGSWHGAALRLAEEGLLLAENRAAPRAEWVTRVPAVVWDALRGQTPRLAADGLWLHGHDEFPALEELVLDERLREKLARVPEVLEGGHVRAVVLRGMAGGGRRTIMGSLARALGRRLLVFKPRGGPKERDDRNAVEDPWRLAGPVATLARAFPVFSIDPAPGETFELPALAGYRGPVGVVMRREGGAAGEAVRHAVTLELPPPAPAHRREVWTRALGPRVNGALDEIAAGFILPLGHVHRAGHAAAAYAALERREHVAAEDVRAACRTLNRQKLDTLAQRLEAGGGWTDLVLDEITAAGLADLERRCRNRERLLPHLGAGFGNSANRGVRALFDGPSGTGKTLAARVLASVLKTDVYRVDLASVVNKYIGETEKNLSQLLARAEELDVILLVDEGDALLTSRTDVKSANDRYANLETNYLLQRLETYEGVVVVTTNAGNRIDQAFQRRFDVLVSFQPPDAQERLLIWRLHLPAEHSVSRGFLEEAAQQCALTGGQIRNAALYATLLAVDGGRGGQVRDEDAEAAVRREYQKAGASCPLRRRGLAGGHGAALEGFLAELG